MLDALIRRYRLFEPPNPIRPESSFRLISQNIDLRPVRPSIKNLFPAPPIRSTASAQTMSESAQQSYPEVIRPAQQSYSEIAKILEPPKTPRLDAYSAWINEMPQRTPPRWWNKLAAALAGASTGYQEGAGKGLETAYSYLEAPYQKRLQDWLNRGAGLKEAADIESKNIQSGASIDKSILSALVGFDRNQVARERIAQNAQNVAAKLGQSNWRYVGMTEDGNPILLDSTSGQASVLKDIDMFSEPEKLNKQIEGSLKRAGIMAQAQTTAAQIGANATVEAARMRLEAAQNAADKINASLEALTDNRAIAALASKYPDIIRMNDKGKLEVVPPTAPTRGIMSIFGQEQTATPEYLERYQQLQQELDSIRRSPVSRKASTPSYRTGRTYPDGTVDIIGPNGEVEYHRVPKDMVDRALRELNGR